MKKKMLIFLAGLAAMAVQAEWTLYDDFSSGTLSSNLWWVPSGEGVSMLETTENLSSDWQSISNFNGTGGWVDLNSSLEATQHFYRVRVWPTE